LVTDKTEEEQVEAVKTWFAENGTTLVVGIALSLAAVFGYQAWETSVREKGEAASELYENLTAAVSTNPMDDLKPEARATADFIANQLKADYASSTYAHFAAMHLAKLDVESGDLAAAATELQWVLDHQPEESLASLVRLRLAQVKLALGEHDAALALLDPQQAGGYGSSYAEARGDVLFAMGKLAEAREAYQQAINNLTQGNTKPMLSMKLEDLVAPPAVVPADPAVVAAEAETAAPAAAAAEVKP
jgi:predicted negative regulator of RcsB-dependent stress response